MKLNKDSKVEMARIFIDGAGMRPDGTGSGYAWINETTGVQRIKQVDGLTNNQAEYRGLLYALRNVQPGTNVTVCSDSQLLCEQFAGRWAVRDPELKVLLARAREILAERKLNVTLVWVPRSQNLAGKLMESVAG